MHLLIVGLSHKSAPLDVREICSFSPLELQPFLQALTCQAHDAAVSRSGATCPARIAESVVISTCNRLEVVVTTSAPDVAIDYIISLLGRLKGTSGSALRRYLYCLQDEEAVTHLMRVATGLDSMVLGEAQILGQLVRAYQTALEHKTARATLSRLFQAAIRAGKRARTETAIGHNPASVSSIAVRLAENHLGSLAEQVVLVLGAGDMGALTVQTLLKSGIKKLLIVNRTLERAEKLALAWRLNTGATIDIQALTLTDLGLALEQADVVVSATGATTPILSHQHVARAMGRRPRRPMLIVDIGLPRDVETAAGQLPDVHLYNIDDLEAQVAASLQDRRREIPQVEVIIAQETARFRRWRRTRRVVPAITNFRQQTEQIKEQELTRTLKRLQHLDQRDQQLVAELAHRLTKKFLHEPTIRLKAEAAEGNGVVYTETLRELFGLEYTDPA